MFKAVVGWFGNSSYDTMIKCYYHGQTLNAILESRLKTKKKYQQSQLTIKMLVLFCIALLVLVAVINLAFLNRGCIYDVIAVVVLVVDSIYLDQSKQANHTSTHFETYHNFLIQNQI